MKRRTVWTVLWICCLVSVNLFFAVAIFGSLAYAAVVMGYWYADGFIYD